MMIPWTALSRLGVAWAVQFREGDAWFTLGFDDDQCILMPMP